MTNLMAWLIATPVVSVILAFTVREIYLYEHDRRTRSAIYPYTKRRLARRCIVSGFLITTVILLLFGPHWPFVRTPAGFVAYTLGVIFLAVVLIGLAIADLRESHRLHAQGERHLLSELIHEVERGKSPPEIH